MTRVPLSLQELDKIHGIGHLRVKSIEPKFAHVSVQNHGYMALSQFISIFRFAEKT